MNCNYCNEYCVKRGFQNKIQRYFCKSCVKFQQAKYQNKVITAADAVLITRLVSDSCSIRGMARIIGCAPSTIQRWVLKIANDIHVPWYSEYGQEYQVDEMWTFIGENKPSNFVWITYAINRKTKDIISYKVGSRSKNCLNTVTDCLLDLYPKKIYTDKWKAYPALIPNEVHSTVRYKTNLIERMNLTIRNRVKRLSRKSLSITRSKEMLEATIKIFFQEINWSFFDL